MIDVQGGDISAHEIISKFSILYKLLHVKKRSKLYPDLPTSGDKQQFIAIPIGAQY